MGLDLYVRWEGITEDEEKAQITGYVDAPEVGYLRFSWPAVAAVSEFAATHGLTCPVPAHELWEGCNGETLAITPESLTLLQGEKAAMQQQLQTFNFAWYSDLGLFVQRKMENSVRLIEFIESKFGKPELTLVYG